MIEKWIINGKELIFDDEPHTYYYDGEECVSVTTVIKTFFPTKYANVKKEVMDKSSNYGTEVHNSVEAYEKLGLERQDLQEFRNYLFLKDYYKFKVIASEIPIVFRYKNLLVAGKIDQIISEIIDDKESLSINDIKTTAVLDKESLSMQCSMYKYGAIRSYGYNIEGLRATHLKNKIRKFVVVDELDVEKLLDEYLEIKEEENEEIKKRRN